MKTKTAVIIAVIVIALIGIVAGAVIALGNAVNNITGENAEVTYNYEVGESISSYDYYTEYDHKEVKASEGKIFAVVKIIEKNNNLSSKYIVTTDDFKFVCSDGNTYSRNWDASYYYSKTFEDTTVADDLSKGETWQYTVLVEIPTGTKITDIKFDFTNYTSYRDTNLKIDSTIGNQDKGTPSVLYNFKYDKTANTIDKYTAGEGKTYVVYIVTEKNNNVSKGMSLTSGDFKIKCSDGNSYDANYTVSKTYSETSTAFGTSLGMGNTATYHLVFEISTSLSENTTIVWGGLYSGAQDSTLPVVVA